VLSSPEVWIMQLFVGTSVSANTRPAGHREELRRQIPRKSQCTVHTIQYWIPFFFFTGNYLVFQITWNNFWWNNRVDYYVMGSLVFLRLMLRFKWGFWGFQNLSIILLLVLVFKLSFQFNVKWKSRDHKKEYFYKIVSLLFHHLLGKIKWNEKKNKKWKSSCNVYLIQYETMTNCKITAKKCFWGHLHKV